MWNCRFENVRFYTWNGSFHIMSSSPLVSVRYLYHLHFEIVGRVTQSV